MNPEKNQSDHNKVTKPNRWLNEFTSNVTSQYGEDGILTKIFEIIPGKNKWCVEFGAWDGKLYSNTYNLINQQGYSAVLIEANPNRYQDLIKTYYSNKKVIPLNAFVGFETKNSLDTLLEATETPVDFDLLSIDIDGNDYHVWKAVQNYKPKVVVKEYNPTIPNKVEFVQKPDMRINQGCSLLSVDKLARSQGYELVVLTQTNAIFVDSRYFALFNINDNSLEKMRPNESAVTYIFNGFDGTVFIR